MTVSNSEVDIASEDPAVKQFTRLLSRSLVHAFYWMDDGLQNYMQDQVGFSLPRGQSMMMICIGDGICRQSDIAKHLRITKQAVRQSIKELELKGLVVIDQDPSDGRQKILRFTSNGEQMREVARGGLERLERLLEERIGRANIHALENVLELDWGGVPTAAELNKGGER